MRALLIGMALLLAAAGCARPVGRARVPRREAWLHDRELPTELEFQLAFEARLLEVRGSPACAQPRAHAVLTERSPRGETFLLGFCDGLVVGMVEDGSVVHAGSWPPPGTREIILGVNVPDPRIVVPERVSLRRVAGEVRLVGKRFDLRIRSVRGSECWAALRCPAATELVEQGEGFVLCRRGRRHQLRACARTRGLWLLVQSRPDMQASRAQVEEMLRSVQLMNH